MSSESSIFLHERLVRGQVTDLEGTGATTVALILLDEQGARHTNDERFILFIPDDRRLEAALLFHKIAQDLAALLPDVDACCRCVPGTPDDQCAAHGYGAFKIEKARAEHDGECSGIATCVDHPEGEEPVCPLCDEPSPDGEVHMDCAHREQCRVDAEAEANREPTDTIPIEEAAEHVDPPHRWG